MPRLSIVVPVYNEEAAIAATCERLVRTAGQIKMSRGIGEVEIVFVDDGSRDRSAAILTEQSKKASGVELKVLQCSRNFGHSAAVFAGLEHGKGDLYAIIDADLQDPPEIIGDMISVLENQQVDVVYGQRQVRRGESVFKLFTAWLFYRLLNVLSGTDIPKDTGDFRVMTKEVRDVILELSENEPFLRGLVAWVGFRQLPFVYERQPRLLGETKYPFRKMLRFAIQAIMSFSSSPLRVAIYAGAVGILLSSFVALYAFIVWWHGEPVPGWTSLMIGFMYGQSLTLSLIGVLGLYLGRVHSALQRRPRYILRREVR